MIELFRLVSDACTCAVDLAGVSLCGQDGDSSPRQVAGVQGAHSPARSHDAFNTASVSSCGWHGRRLCLCFVFADCSN